MQEVWKTQTGELEARISMAVRKGILRPDLNDAAHKIRKKGNDAVHGPAPEQKEVTSQGTNPADPNERWPYAQQVVKQFD